jgi:tRNA (cytidine/uridine-2'-O-)-methyltransferase
MAFAWRDLRSTLMRSVLGQDCVLCAAASGAGLLCAACAADLPQVAEACCSAGRASAAVCGAADAPAAVRRDDRRRGATSSRSIAWCWRRPGGGALAEAGAALADRAAGRRVDALAGAGRARLPSAAQPGVEIARHPRGPPTSRRAGLAHRCATPRRRRPAARRARGTRGAFRRRDAAGRTPAVIDDAMTTGASSRARAMLKRAGAARVENWPSRGPGPARDPRPDRMLDVVLYQPEIPPNTGNALRLCANAGCRLHLVRPLGFLVTDRALRRAVLDYDDIRSAAVHDDWDAALARPRGRRLFAFSTHAARVTPTPASPRTTCVFDRNARPAGGRPDAIAPDQRLRLPMVAAAAA